MKRKLSGAIIVDEFIAEMDSALAGPQRSLPPGVKVTKDASEANAFAHKNKKHKNSKRLWSLGEKWVKRVYSESARVSQLYQYEIPGLSLELANESSRALEYFEKVFLAKAKAAAFTSMMYVYVPLILDARVAEPNNALASQLSSILSARGIPCGCYGTWPESPIVVYWPWKKEEPIVAQD